MERRNEKGEGGGVTLAVYLRSLSPATGEQAVERVVKRVKRLCERGVVDDYSVTVWGNAICPGSEAARSPVGREASRLLEAFEEWTDRTGRSIGDGFPRQDACSLVTGEEYEKVIFPLVTLVEYRGDEVTFVSPSAGRERTWSVEDRLDAIERRETEPALHRPVGLADGAA